MNCTSSRVKACSGVMGHPVTSGRHKQHIQRKLLRPRASFFLLLSVHAMLHIPDNFTTQHCVEHLHVMAVHGNECFFAVYYCICKTAVCRPCPLL